MRDEELRQLLRAADEGEIEVRPDLPRRVRRKRAVRRVRNATVVSAVIAIGVSAFWLHYANPPSRGDAQLAMDVAALQREADAYAAQAKLLEAQEKLARAQAASAVIAAQREQAATILLKQCDWLAQHDGDAQADYAKLAQEFGDTRAGKQAKEKLNERKEG